MSEYLLSLVGLLILVAVPVSLFLYGKFIAQLRREGGKVRTDWVGIPDLPMALIVGGALTVLALNGLLQSNKAPAAMTPEQIVPGMLFLLVLGGGIAVFLVARRLGLIPVFGLRQLSPPSAFGRGLLLLLAAVPTVVVFSAATAYLLGEQAREQDLVRLFSDVAQKGDFGSVFLIVFAGVVVAPVCEEILFRGYFYPVAKRYLGAGVGALLTATVFAASHVNLASLPGLLALALSFVIGYERTGSLLVPISMHAIFNAANLLLLFLVSISKS